MRFIFIVICLIFLTSCDKNPFNNEESSKQKDNKKTYYIPSDPTYIYKIGDDGRCYEVATIEGSTWYEEVCMNYCDDTNTYYDLYEAIYFGVEEDSYCLQYEFSDNGTFIRRIKEIVQDKYYPVLWYCTGDIIEEENGNYEFNGILTELILNYSNNTTVIKPISSPGGNMFTEYDGDRYYNFQRTEGCLVKE